MLESVILSTLFVPRGDCGKVLYILFLILGYAVFENNRENSAESDAEKFFTQGRSDK